MNYLHYREVIVTVPTTGVIYITYYTCNKKLHAHLDSSKLTGQVQRGLLCLVDQTRVGLMLQQHLRLKQPHNIILMRSTR